MDDDTLRYPIGQFRSPDLIDRDQRAAWVDDIATLPRDLRAVVESLDDVHLGMRYRPGSWTVRQVVHHVADSHLNSFVRFKWALTEQRPRIKAYDEVAWAELGDAGQAPVAPSLDLLDALHARWVVLLESLSLDDWRRTFIHPESGPIQLGANVGVYAWHGRHHLAHVERVARGGGVG